ncbi:MAG: signal peptidase II [Clostridia bacterium]|nr:MAG: signal peptidase II [Clostridia bacterium]
MAFGLDQTTKIIVDRLMIPGESTPVINGAVYMTYAQNSGAAFGLFPDRTSFFVVVTVAVIALLFLIYHRAGRQVPWLSVSLGLQVGGALGNFVDRVRLGYVIDFIDLRFWPIFNLADVAIVIGVLLLAVTVFGQSEAGSEHEHEW